MKHDTSAPVDGSDSHYTDPNPSLSIDEVVAKEKETHQLVIQRGKPGSNGKDPPVSTDGHAVNAGPYWEARMYQDSLHISVSQKRKKVGLPFQSLAQDLAS